MNEREELISIIKGFNPEQLEKFRKILNVVKDMNDNQMIFTETLLCGLFGEGSSDAV